MNYYKAVQNPLLMKPINILQYELFNQLHTYAPKIPRKCYSMNISGIAEFHYELANVNQKIIKLSRSYKNYPIKAEQLKERMNKLDEMIVLILLSS